jgi:hypothetical protein
VDAPTDTPAAGTVANTYAEDLAPETATAQAAAHDAPTPPGPDNPPWGVGAALLVWLASVGLLFIVPTLAGAGYIIARLRHLSAEQLGAALLADPHFILISVAAVIPAHLLTFWLVWWLVTQNGRHSFGALMGWRWSHSLGALEIFSCIGVVVLLVLINSQIGRYFPGGDTDLEKIISSSLAARYVIVVLATFSAPLVEEAVYRGVLYPALRRAIGTAWAVLAVSLLFASVHVYQYRANVGVIMAITLLSLALTLVRARTGRLLPCVVIHFLFNGVTSIWIVLAPYMKELAPPTPPAPTGLLLSALARMLRLHL